MRWSPDPSSDAALAYAFTRSRNRATHACRGVSSLPLSCFICRRAACAFARASAARRRAAAAQAAAKKKEEADAKKAEKEAAAAAKKAEADAKKAEKEEVRIRWGGGFAGVPACCLPPCVARAR